MSELSQVTLDQILFCIFVRLVDQEQSIGLRDIERLDRLFAKPKLLGIPALELGIEGLNANYQTYWRLYQEKKLAQHDEELIEQLTQYYLQKSPLVWMELQQGLNKFIQYVCVGAGLSAKLRTQKNLNPARLAHAAKLSTIINAWQPYTMADDALASLDTSSITLIRAYQAQLHRLMTDSVEGDSHLLVSAKGTHRLICAHIHDENDQVKTFTFVREDLSAWAFMPGQFMTFEIPMVDGILRRSYSISSSPYRPYSIDVTVKHLPEGRGSSWLHHHMAVGRSITAHGPHGNFSVLNSLVDQEKPKIALFAAGVGITPLMSMLEYVIGSKQACDVVLINRVHSMRSLIFAQQLSTLQPASNQIIRQITVSSDLQGNWNASLGLSKDASVKVMSPESLTSLVPDILERDIYLCGPDSFKDSVFASLRFLNADPKRFSSESFGGLNQQSSALLRGEHVQQVGSMVGGYLKHLDQEISPEDECFVEFKKSGKTIRCAKGDLVLDIAEFNGVSIPNSCRSGSCGTCKCYLSEGSVNMDCEDGLTLSELAEGNILTCVGHVNSKKVVIDA
jgi:ferredoxin-NADP reductase